MLYLGNNKVKAKLNNNYIYFPSHGKTSEVEIYPYIQNVVLELNRLEPIILDITPLDTKNIFPSYSILNSEIIEIKAGVVIPKKIGVTSVDIIIHGAKISIQVTIIDSVSLPDTPAESVYIVDLKAFNISNNGSNAIDTSNGINSMLSWAVFNNYKKVVFPNGVYLISETIPIALKSNLIVDLGGSKIKLNPSSKTNIKIIDIPQNSINIRLENGIIEGDKDSRLSDNETVHGIVLNGGKNVSIDNIEITNILAYGIYWTVGYRKNNIYISKDNLQTLDDKTWCTINYIDISNLLDVYQISNPFGEGSLHSIKGSDMAFIDIEFYDANKQLIYIDKNLKFFRSYPKPTNAKYIKLSFRDIIGIGDGNTDFGNSVAFITDYNTDNVVISNCNINNCKALGIAYCGSGSNNAISNCTFSNNGGSYASMDLDLEDGWDYMQGLVVNGCNFTSRHNFHTCGGFNNVLYNNTFTGMITSSSEGRSSNLRIIDNKFDFSAWQRHIELYCEWYSGGLYIEGNSFINCLTNIYNLRKNVNRVYLKSNVFEGGSLTNMSSTEVFDLTSNTFINCNVSNKGLE